MASRSSRAHKFLVKPIALQPDCQRARKRQWQRAKLQSDFDYRINQRAAQQAWSQRSPDYWSNYRDTRPEYEQLNREQQRLCDLRGRDAGFAKMDECGLPTGLYRIARHPVFPTESGTESRRRTVQFRSEA